MRKVGTQTQYEVEWEHSWTSGKEVRPAAHHGIVEGKDSPDTWDIVRVRDTRVGASGEKEYLVEWARTWEPAQCLMPEGGRTSDLICEYYATKWRKTAGVATPREPRPEHTTDARPDTVDTRELNKLLTLMLEDSNPDMQWTPNRPVATGCTGPERTKE